jgi:hypothetical protein
MVIDYRDRIAELARTSPLQPTSLGKLLGTNSLFASAMLSEMTGKGVLKVSSLKVGSSPLYYAADHPEHLLNFIVYLNEKERRVAELLKEKGVLRDSSLDPLQRVCVRSIKDFARQLDVSMGDSKEVFWKWFLLPDDQTNAAIKQLLEPISQPEKKVEAPAQVLFSAPVSAPISASIPAVVSEPQKVSEQKKVETLVAQVSAEHPKVRKHLPKPCVQEIARPAEEVREEIRPIVVDNGDLFLKRVRSFFEKNKIVIRELTTVKKKTEFDIIIEVPSPLGSLVYFCKAKNNKRISNSDLSNAYVQGQLKKLPVVFLSPGELAKPAKVFMKDLKGLTVSRL